MRIIELCYFKTVPHECREAAFTSKNLANKNQDLNEESHAAERIARYHLDQLVKQMLQIVLLIIKFNQKNSESMTKFDHVFFVQMRRFPIQSGKVFKEMFKRAEYIFGDKSSAVTYSDGLDIDAIEQLESVQIEN